MLLSSLIEFTDEGQKLWQVNTWQLTQWHDLANNKHFHNHKVMEMLLNEDQLESKITL